MNPANISRYEFEVVGTDNPLTLNLGNLGKVIGVELESFDYLPNTTPTYKMIGVTMNGIKGRYNKLGNSINCLRSIPITNGRFSYNATETDMVQMQTQECSLNVGFIVRTSDDTQTLNRTNVQFDNNYLLNFSVLVQK